MPIIVLPLLSFLVTPWACGLMFLSCLLTSSLIFYLGLPWLAFYIFTSIGLCWPTFLLCASPFHYFIPSVSLTRLLLLYLFYSHGLFARFFGLSRLITTSLPIITLRAYWPLSQSIEFTNSSPRLPRPHLLLLYHFLFSCIYYFIFWALSVHLLILYLFFILMGLLAINPAILAYWACFLIPLPFSFSHLLYCWASFVVGPFAINGHQHQPIQGRWTHGQGI